MTRQRWRHHQKLDRRPIYEDEAKLPIKDSNRITHLLDGAAQMVVLRNVIRLPTIGPQAIVVMGGERIMKQTHVLLIVFNGRNFLPVVHVLRPAG